MPGMVDWASLQHAYGSAVDIPDLLVAAERSGAEYGPEWDEVWGCLCHQGTVYTASYAALPLLAGIAQRHAPAGYVAAVDLAAGIVASTDGPGDRTAVRREYSAVLADLREVALRNLPLAGDDVEFVYGLQAVMAFEDGDVWQRQLTYVADAQLPLQCPGCYSARPTPARPADPEPGTPGWRMLTLAGAPGRTVVAARLRYALGDATCPSCGTAVDIPDALT
jgi:hypothetical protein